MKTLFIALLALVACGQKKPPEPAAEPMAPAVTEAPTPTPVPEPMPEPDVEAPPASNADLQATLSFGGGRRVAGQVTRVERGADWFGQEWTDSAMKLTLPLESGSDLKEVPWEEVESVQITYGKREEISCQYDSDFSPWMYICTLPSQSTVRLTDGSTWKTTSRHPWRFTFDDGTVEEFFVYKLPARRQDTAENARTGTENYDLYGDLQTELMQNVGAALIAVSVQ